jgi:hypothetical protein
VNIGDVIGTLVSSHTKCLINDHLDANVARFI